MRTGCASATRAPGWRTFDASAEAGCFRFGLATGGNGHVILGTSKYVERATIEKQASAVMVIYLVKLMTDRDRPEWQND